MKIKVNTIQDVIDFVQLVTENCHGEVLAKQGKYIINAKSIMGLFSLDLMKSFDLTGEEEIDKNIFKNFIAEE